MARHYYSSVAVDTTLTSGISDSTTTMTVGSTTGFPGSFPYYLVISKNAGSMEIVEVTNAVGLTLTIVRGRSGTSGVAHIAGVPIEHDAPSDFFNQNDEHAFATTDVHGVTGNLNTVIGALDTRLDALEDSVPTEAQGRILVAASATSGTAINAATAALPAGGGRVLLAAGTHTLNTAVLFSKSGVIYEGHALGTLLQFDGGVVTTAMAMTDTTQRQIYLRDFRINTTTGSDNTGTAIDASYFFNSVIERVTIGSSSTQTPNVGIKLNALGTYYNSVNDCRIQVGGASSVGVLIGSNANDNAIRNTKILGDTSTTSVQINTAHSTVLDHVSSDTANMAIGVDLQAAAHDTTMIGCYFELMGIGLKVASGVESARYIGGYISSSGTANIQDNGAVGMTIDNSWVEFNPYNSIDRTGVVKSKMNGVNWPDDNWGPGDLSAIAWNYDPIVATNNTVVTNGTLYLAQINLRYAVTITNLIVGLSTGATTSVASQNYLGLYNAAGTLVASTAATTADTPFQTSGIKVLALSAPYAAAAGKYWVAVLANASVAPAPIRALGTPTIANMNLSAANFRFATNGTGLTTLPGSITPASNTTGSGASTNTFTCWVAAS